MNDLINELSIDVESKIIRRGVKELRHMGVRPGGPLLIHSSFKAVRAKAQTIENVVAGLALSLGKNGTVLFPTLTYERVHRQSPVFDVAHTPSNVGAIPEFFRNLSITKRSDHPTHSVCAYGAEADFFVRGHELDRTPVGPNSPFRKLRGRKGQLLMLGCGLTPNTSMHGIEEMANAPYIFGPPITYTIKHNHTVIAKEKYTPHGFDHWLQRYERIQRVLPARSLDRGRVFGAEAWLIEVSDLWEKCAQAIQREPYFFVARG